MNTKCNNCNCKNNNCCNNTKNKGLYNKFMWLIKELINMYSNEKSHFSKKRVESGLAFLIMQAGLIFYFVKNVYKMDMYDVAMWACINGFIAGYTLDKIQKEKIAMLNKHTNDDNNVES